MSNQKFRKTGAQAAGRPPEASAATVLRVSYQGVAGAYSHLACLNAFPDATVEAEPCPTFEDALASVVEGKVRYAMIPIENSIAGRVADIHHLLPKADLHIVGEHFERVRHQLLALPGTTLDGVKHVLSHTQALGQCRVTIRRLGLQPVPEADTAGSAKLVRDRGDPSRAAIASELAAKLYGLQILMRDIEDTAHNTTRFIILARESEPAAVEDGPVITTFLFRVKNVPAALYKALGGFATNGINMTKLESYQLDGAFAATMFYADIEGHPADPGVQHAFDELRFFTSEAPRILGSYRASPYRQELTKQSTLAKLVRHGG
ncbi:MAG: prephenate dehydratase [Hyphomicrobiaceae bacterium]